MCIMQDLKAILQNLKILLVVLLKFLVRKNYKIYKIWFFENITPWQGISERVPKGTRSGTRS